MNGLPLRLSELGLIRITRQTPWAVHFELMQRYYVLKESADDVDGIFTLYLKPLRGGRGHWKRVCSGWGSLPFPRYRGKRAVYSQADVREWALRLVSRKIITIVADNPPESEKRYREMRKKELLCTLSAGDAMTVFGIETAANPCPGCGMYKACPVRKCGAAVTRCGYGISTL